MTDKESTEPNQTKTPKKTRARRRTRSAPGAKAVTAADATSASGTGSPDAERKEKKDAKTTAAKAIDQTKRTAAKRRRKPPRTQPSEMQESQSLLPGVDESPPAEAAEKVEIPDESAWTQKYEDQEEDVTPGRSREPAPAGKPAPRDDWPTFDEPDATTAAATAEAWSAWDQPPESALAEAEADQPLPPGLDDLEPGAAGQTEAGTAATVPATGRKRRRGRRGRGRRNRDRQEPVEAPQGSNGEAAPAAPIEEPPVLTEAETRDATATGWPTAWPFEATEKPAAEVPSEAPAAPPVTAEQAEQPLEQQPGDRKRRRRRRRRGRGGNGGNGAAATPAAARGAPKPAQAGGGPQPGPQPQPQRAPAAAATPLPAGARLMLINVAEGEECRIAILHQKRLEELFIERASAESHVGNIYKGRITNVEPSIQAAFVDFGLPKNGFLHISDLQPQYFPGNLRTVEEVGRKTPRRERPPIQKCLRRGQEIIVQIIKEGIGTKGPTLTTYISIPGRYLVMMPGMNRLGVSRRIEDEETRRKMRRLLDELDLPKEMGFILRTAGLEQTKKELQKDLLYLQRLWKIVATRIKSERAPCELYRESDLVIRTIRDVYSSEFSKIIVDDEHTAEKVRDFLSIAMPRSSAPVDLYAGRRPLFHEYGLETEIDRINSRYVPLPAGGSLIIESTEAMVAIDVNSGRFREHDDAEETAYRINLEAAEEIARQLRLRDLGGLILCDFIDMRLEKHRRGVEKALRDALKKHKERAKCLRMSQFGIIEMTRQRMRPSIKRSIYQDCPHCRGSGLVKNTESMTLDIMRLLRLATHHDQVDSVEVRVSPDVAFQLQNRKRVTLNSLEQATGRKIIIRADSNLGPDQYALECFDQRGGGIRIMELPDATKGGPDPRQRGRLSQPLEPRPERRETLEDVFD